MMMNQARHSRPGHTFPEVVRRQGLEAAWALKWREQSLLKTLSDDADQLPKGAIFGNRRLHLKDCALSGWNLAASCLGYGVELSTEGSCTISDCLLSTLDAKGQTWVTGCRFAHTKPHAIQSLGTLYVWDCLFTGGKGIVGEWADVQRCVFQNCEPNGPVVNATSGHVVYCMADIASVPWLTAALSNHHNVDLRGQPI